MPNMEDKTLKCLHKQASVQGRCQVQQSGVDNTGGESYAPPQKKIDCIEMTCFDAFWAS